MRAQKKYPMCEWKRKSCFFLFHLVGTLLVLSIINSTIPLFARSLPLYSSKQTKSLKRIYAQTQRLLTRFEKHPKAVHLKAIERKIKALESLLLLYFQNQSHLDHRETVLESRKWVMKLFHKDLGLFVFANDRFCIRTDYRQKWAYFWKKRKHMQRARHHLRQGLACGAPQSWWIELAELYPIKERPPSLHSRLTSLSTKSEP